MKTDICKSKHSHFCHCYSLPCHCEGCMAGRRAKWAKAEARRRKR